MGNKKVPEAIWEGTFKLYGVDVRCVTLDNGMRIIEKDSLEELLKAMELEKNTTIPLGDLEGFVKWKEGSSDG